MVKHKIKIRNEGDKSQYYTLTIVRKGMENEIHTSKSRGYLLKFIPKESIEME